MESNASHPDSSNLSNIIRDELLGREGITTFTPNRRFETVFSEGSPAGPLFYIESGLVKLFKRGADSKEVILDILGQGEIFGEQTLEDNSPRNLSAEILAEGVIQVIPRELFMKFCNERPQAWNEAFRVLIGRKRRLETKIELLCLKDVEHRALYYLAELARTVGLPQQNGEYIVPLSQGEFASLIGATRETTSTTLNALARRGLIRLARRQLVVLSLARVQAEMSGQPSASLSTHSTGV